MKDWKIYLVMPLIGVLLPAAERVALNRIKMWFVV